MYHTAKKVLNKGSPRLTNRLYFTNSFLRQSWKNLEWAFPTEIVTYMAVSFLSQINPSIWHAWQTSHCRALSLWEHVCVWGEGRSTQNAYTFSSWKMSGRHQGIFLSAAWSPPTPVSQSSQRRDASGFRSLVAASECWCLKWVIWRSCYGGLWRDCSLWRGPFCILLKLWCLHL